MGSEPCFATTRTGRIRSPACGSEEQAEKTQGLLVTPNWFDLLGVRFLAGRGFSLDEGKTPGKDAVAVIGEGLWRRRFHSDPALIGQTIELNDHRFTVIGVAAAFQLDVVYFTPEVWAPLTMHAQLDPAFDRLLRKSGGPSLLDSDSGSLKWLARLKADVSFEQARAAVELLAQQLGQARSPSILAQYPVTVVPQMEYNRAQMSRTAPVSVFLLALAGLVLLIACSNLANLMLTRATARSRELAVRLALGPGRFRIVRQLLVEGVLLALLSGAAGLLLSRWTGELLARFVGAMGARSMLPMRPEATLDPAVFTYTLLVSLIAGVAVVILPAWRASREDLIPALKGEAGALTQRSPIFELQPLAHRIDRWRLQPQLGAILVGAIGVLSLALAALGLYGTLAYAVAQRTREFGVRLALGAPRMAVICLVLRQGMRLVFWGSAIGLVAALAGTRYVTHLLFGVSPLDAAAFAGVLLLLTLVAFIASYVPAWRATKVDPMEALRYE